MKSIKVDPVSFELGALTCFAEMVACGVKRLALGPPMTPEFYEQIKAGSDEIVQDFGIRSYLEHGLMVTYLQTPEFTRGKWTLLYYKEDATLEAYLVLKEKQRALQAAGDDDEPARREISRQFMRLLSYPEDVIEARIAQYAPREG